MVVEEVIVNCAIKYFWLHSTSLPEGFEKD
jgi:hypothetical protein